MPVSYTHLDVYKRQNVGRVLDSLKEKNMLDNTLVVYTSDQGFYMGEHGLSLIHIWSVVIVFKKTIARFPTLFIPPPKLTISR